MESHLMRDRRTKEWTCCGNVWQLTMSTRFPGRVQWSPVCPGCGKKGSPHSREKCLNTFVSRTMTEENDMPLNTDYRPKNFDEIVGNKATVASLKAIYERKSDWPHAVLLTGPKGCGTLR